MNEKPNTLFVHTRGMSLRVDGNAVRADVEGEPPRRMPLLRLSDIVLFGSVHVSAKLIHRCGDEGIGIVWLDSAGRFKGRLQGPTRGNVFVRSNQHAAQRDPTRCLALATRTVVAKIEATARFAAETDRYRGQGTCPHPAAAIRQAKAEAHQTPSLDELRGIEGVTARRHFENVAASLTTRAFPGRTRRPPTDPVNAAISFVYGLVATRCVGAAEAAGLDPHVGFLHTNRPGRPGLALDLMEPLRPVADRIVVTMLNRSMLLDTAFERHVSGAVTLSEKGRRAIIDRWVTETNRSIKHPTARVATTLGILPLIEARIVARILREDGDPALLPVAVF